MATLMSPYDAVKASLLFTKLPFELRQRIFSMVLYRRDIAQDDVNMPFKLLSSAPSMPTKSIASFKKDDTSHQHRLALICACKAVSGEASQILHQIAVLRVAVPVHAPSRANVIPYLPMPTTEALKNVRHLELCVLGDRQTAINYLKYLFHMKKRLTCHVRFICGPICHKLSQKGFALREGYNLRSVEDHTGLRTRFFTVLLDFLSTFEAVVISWGLLEESFDAWVASGTRANEGMFHSMAMCRLGDHCLRRAVFQRNIDSIEELVDGDKSKRIAFKRSTANPDLPGDMRRLAFMTMMEDRGMRLPN